MQWLSKKERRAAKLRRKVSTLGNMSFEYDRKFAWLPVTDGFRVVWLEWYWRSKNFSGKVAFDTRAK